MTTKLTAQEERSAEQVGRQEHLFLMRQCIADARNVLKDEKMMDMQSHVLSVALSLFKKRADHVQLYKDRAVQKKMTKPKGKVEAGNKKV